MLLASATDVIGSSGVLGFVLGGGLLTAVIGGYRFFVNFRVTERGMARDRVAQAVRAERDERRARQRVAREASLWQGRSADLEYILRQHGVAVPALSGELYSLLNATNAPGESAAISSDSGDDGGGARTSRTSRSRRPRRRDADYGADEDEGAEEDDLLAKLDDRLRREEKDELNGVNAFIKGISDSSDNKDTSGDSEEKGRTS